MRGVVRGEFVCDFGGWRENDIMFVCWWDWLSKGEEIDDVEGRYRCKKINKWIKKFLSRW